jgi:hypothetical protein
MSTTDHRSLEESSAAYANIVPNEPDGLQKCVFLHLGRPAQKEEPSKEEVPETSPIEPLQKCVFLRGFGNPAQGE